MSQLKVLLVDDEEDLVSALSARMGFRGIEAKCALNGPDALQLVKDETFDVVILDLKLPGMTGDQVLEVLKKEHPGLPVILITGHGAPPEEVVAEARQDVDIMEKPVDLDALLQRINEVVKKP